MPWSPWIELWLAPRHRLTYITGINATNPSSLLHKHTQALKPPKLQALGYSRQPPFHSMHQSWSLTRMRP